MTIECVPNNDRSDILDLSDSDESDDEYDKLNRDEIEEHPEIKKIDKAIGSLIQELSDAKEMIISTTMRIGFLDSYGKTLDSKDQGPDTVAQYLQLYDDQRQQLYEIHKFYSTKGERLEKGIQQKVKERGRLVEAKQEAALKACRKERKRRMKDKEVRAAQRAEKRRLKEQIMAFWPKKVYKVVLSLEACSDVTPSTSQSDLGNFSKGSGDPDRSMGPEQALPISLSLSYVTREAFWYPVYTVQLSTPSRSGTIAYRAEFQNATSETWRNAKIILSTSQTSFSGLVDTIPTLTPWHVRLAKRDSITSRALPQYEGQGAQAKAWEGALESKYEKGERKRRHGLMPNSNREELFGVTSARFLADRPSVDSPFLNTRSVSNAPSGAYAFGAIKTQAYHQAQQQQQQQPPPMQMLQMAIQPPKRKTSRAREEGFSEKYEEGEDDQGFGIGASRELSDGASMISADTITGALAFQESSRESHGLTTTYNLPGARTLGPSHLKRQHLITDLFLNSISLSYVLIPKLRTAAFLKAQIRNTSTVTLLRGRASLTLDGTFLGNTSIPRASPGEAFTLLLGIDPAINVTYAKPSVRRSSGGIFNKEESVVYTRAITITNNKLQKEPVELVVLDQIPVSEDEQLRMAIVQPAGLKNEGDRVKTGEPVTAGQQWGKAIVTLKKNGELAWNVTLNRGASCRLPLEYEARIPASEVIVGLN